MEATVNQAIESLVEKTLEIFVSRKGISLPETLEYEIAVTKDRTHGDFACNVAFKLAKVVKERPNLIADELVLLLEEQLGKRPESNWISKLEVAGGGFINFYIQNKSLAQILLEVHKKNKHFGESTFGAGRQVIVEFVSANPTGPLTIAHGRQAAIGDSLVRILKAAGHSVSAEYYLNDAGRQMNLLGESLYARYLQQLKQDVPLPEEGYKGEYLIATSSGLVREKDDALVRIPKEGAVAFCRIYAGEKIMAGIQEDLKEVRVSFDRYFSESSLYEENAVEEALHYLHQQGYLYEQDGALWFRSTVFGDDKDRVVKKSSGEFTYLAPDIAYHRSKFSRGNNWIINFWGPDHHGYITRLKAACQALGHSSAEIDIRIVQLTTLFRKGQPVRMSTRAGEFVTLRELYQEVGVDATRFFFVARKVESHLDFDLELAKEKSQENPVYYLQYAHARIASLLKFSETKISTQVNLERLESEEEAELIKVISEYPGALVQACQTVEPYRLADYLRELAQSFHKFYSHHRIVTEDVELTAARLLLADAARIVLRNGLELLGISHPDSM